MSEQNRQRGIDANKGWWHNIYLLAHASAATTQTQILWMTPACSLW